MLYQTKHFIADTWTLTRPYWVSEEKWVAWLLLGVIVGLNLGMVFLNVVFNDWNNSFYNSLQQKDMPAFFHQMFRFCWLAALFIIAAVYQMYFNLMLQIRWRRWLTERFLKEWLAQRTYYRLQMGQGPTDNPDQRISEDLRYFVEVSLRLSLGLLSAAVTLVSFLGILWSLSGDLTIPLGDTTLTIPAYMVWVALIYAVLGSVLTQVIGRPLTKLNFQQQRFEADFRYSLVRLRENAEGVALYQGEEPELQTFRDRFGAVVGNWWGIMICRKRLTWFTAGYGQVATIFPYLVAAPRYFSGALDLGGLMQTANAFGQVQESLSWFVDAYVSLAEWRAIVYRLTGFQHAIAVAQAASRFSPGIVLESLPNGPTPHSLTLDNLILHLPAHVPDTDRGEPLLAVGTLSVAPGDSVLISGVSGSGKSTLFRALAGLWPYGTGRIHQPEAARLLFLPQKPYLPIGSLRAALAYPSPADRFPTDDLVEILKACGLAGFTDRLDQIDHWEQRLSPGEQQRIAIARALLQRPDWLFLDEATASCDPETETQLYRLIRERLPTTTVISIGHRTSLIALHQRHLVAQTSANAITQLVPA